LKSQTEEMPRARKRFRLEQHEEQPEAEEGSGDSSTYAYIFTIFANDNVFFSASLLFARPEHET